MWIVENRARTRPCDQFYDRLVLEPKIDSTFCWTGPPPWERWLGRPCWTSSSPWLVCDEVVMSSSSSLSWIEVILDWSRSSPPLDDSNDGSGRRHSSWRPILRKGSCHGGFPARNSSSFSYKRLVPTRGIALGVGSSGHIGDVQVRT